MPEREHFGAGETVARFPAEQLRALVHRAHQAARPSDDGPEGWSLSEMDPTRIVEVFAPAVRLRPGYTLRGYQYRAGADGNGVVYAFPPGAPAPRPPMNRNDLFRPPRPKAALKSWMPALELDQTPWSYVCLSLLGRKLAEFGALWHGVSWGTHTVIGDMPWNERLAGHPLSEPEGWTGDTLSADELEPRVEVTADGAIVRFYTYTGAGLRRVVEHTDRYRNGAVEVERRNVATGPAGYIF